MLLLNLRREGGSKPFQNMFITGYVLILAKSLNYVATVKTF